MIWTLVITIRILHLTYFIFGCAKCMAYLRHQAICAEPKSSVRVWRIRLQLKASLAVWRISQPGKTYYYHSWSWHAIHPYRKLVYTHPKNIRVDVERQKY